MQENLEDNNTIAVKMSLKRDTIITFADINDFMKKIILTLQAPAPVGPYSQAVLVDRTLYISGQIAIDPKTQLLISSDIVSQTAMIMDNIGSILREASMDFSDIIKVSIFIKNMEDFASINEKYSEYFSDNFPARETVEVSRLPKDADIEISVTAYK